MSFGWVSGIKFQVKHFHDLTVCFYTLCSKGIGRNFTKELKQNKIIRYINIKNGALLCFVLDTLCLL